MRESQTQGGGGNEEVPPFAALRMRVVPLRGPISKRSTIYFINRLLYLAAESPREPILMEVSSPGGLVAQSEEIIRIMDNLTCPISTLCRGTVAGTALVIAAHGLRGFRTALPNCRFSGALNLGPVSGDSEPAAGNSWPTELIEMLARDASKGGERLTSWLASGAEFSATQALEAGLIDFISSTAKVPKR
jgi:ATP-dependent Clp protease, protease subunit